MANTRRVTTMLLFFKPKAAYEMRIIDWSTDVCSSELQPLARPRRRRSQRGAARTRTSGLDRIRPRDRAAARQDGRPWRRARPLPATGAADRFQRGRRPAGRLALRAALAARRRRRPSEGPRRRWERGLVGTGWCRKGWTRGLADHD